MIAGNHFHTRKYFGGVFAADLLPPVNINELFFYILNTDFLRGNGKHWVMVNSFSKNGLLEWFDPLGKLPHDYNRELYNYVTNFGKRPYVANSRGVQSPLSDKCGYFCLMMADLRIQGYSLESALSMFDELNLLDNDTIVQKFINEHMREAYPHTFHSS